ncbi:zinc finger protein 423 homolog isoform X3 [Halyomorpha halys]|uniref:zinc finger protein 423 homolog isoform X3 n=1 Tax=Halyomorpha halys TaxID=286706 RepID=UPI0006D52143
MQFMGNSDRLQSVIEKIHANKENNPSPPPEEGETSASETTSEPAESEIGYNFGSAELAPYPCQFCDKAFSRYSYLKKHEQSHSGLLLFRCDFCNRLFKHKRSRDRHIKLHTGDKKYKCTQCEAAFSRSDHLKIHMKTHDNQKPYQCVYCNRGYNTAAALTSHLQNHKKEITSLSASTEKTSNSIFKCLRCNIIFTKSEELYIHMAKKHSRNTEYLKKIVTVGSNSNSEYSCMSCNETFDSVEALQLHIQQKHDDILREHAKDLKIREHDSENSEVSCEVCCMSFSSNKLLKIHIKCVHGVLNNAPTEDLADQTKPTDLSIVKKNEATVPSNNKRLRMTESTNCSIGNNLQDVQYDPGTLLCNQCNAALPDFESFRNHLKSHLEGSGMSTVHGMKQKWFGFCPYCRLSTSSVQELIKHITSHILTTVTEYICQICQKSYYNSNELERHLIEVHSHHLYLCYACKEVFDTKYEIQRHFLVKHFSEMKKFSCCICPTFPPIHSEVEFDLHVRTVHCGFDSSLRIPNVSLQCAYCNENCKSRSELENHMKSHCQSSLSFGKHKCNICDEICHSAAALAEHKLSHCKVVYGSTCSHCKVVLTSEENFISHIMSHNNCSSKTYQLTLPLPCVICRQTLVSEAETRLHAKFHLQIEAIQCSICLQSYGRNDLKDSICVKCFEEQKTLQKCSCCSVVFDSKEEFDKHTEVTCSSSTICEYKCNICLLIMPNSTKLQAHLIEHTFLGCSNFMCYMCNAVFTVSSGLQQHILEHSNLIKPYTCIKCQMQFFFRAELENHMYIHQSQVTKQDHDNKEKSYIKKSTSVSDIKGSLEDSINNNFQQTCDETIGEILLPNAIKMKEEPTSSEEL